MKIFPTGWTVLLLTFLLAGCAADRTFKEGQELLNSGRVNEGLAKMEEATKLDPANVEYRLQLLARRADVTNGLLVHADAARRERRLQEAESDYRSVLALEPQNAMAKRGMEVLTLERRHLALVTEAENQFKKGLWAQAEETLHPVLQENPNQREARNLQERVVEKRQKNSKAPEAKLADAFRKPITLEFKEAPLRSVFDLISKSSGINFFFDKDIRPDLKANIVAHNTSVEDALRLLMVTNQLEQKVLNENSVLIYPNTPQKLKDYQPLSIRTFFLANAEAKNVANTLKTILKTRDLVVDDKLNMLIMRDTPEAIRLAEKLINLQDIGDSEVMLDVEVLEVDRSHLMDLGIQWPGQLSLTPLGAQTSTSTTGTTGTGTTGTTTAASTSGTLTLSQLRHIRPSTIGAALGATNINAQTVDTDSKILANPRIRVKNHEKANILIGDRVPVITTTSTATGFISDSVNYVDVGLKLDVEPVISLDDDVAIKIKLEVSSIGPQVTSKNGTQVYQIGTRGANTVLRLKDGETQVLAGLINDEDRRTGTKIPGMGDLPMVGRLFGDQNNSVKKTEIVLAITPHILRSVRRPDLVMADMESGTETSLGARALGMASAEEAPVAVGKTGAAARPGATVAAPKTSVGANPPAVAPATVAPAAPTDAAPIEATTGNSPTSSASVTAAQGGMFLNWSGPAKAKLAEQFSVVLRVQASQPVSGMPLLIGFDPAALQVVSVVEGDFLKQANGHTNFTSRIDPQGGKIVVANVRQGDGINGAGSVVTINFKAVQAGAQAKISLLSASPFPEPEGGAPNLPADLGVSISN